MPDYLPGSDTEFIAWMRTFLTYASANSSTLGLSTAELTLIQNQQTALETAHADYSEARSQAQAKFRKKDDARHLQERTVRPLVTRLQGTATVTDSHRVALGITVRANSHTLSPTPSSRPLGMIDTSQRLRHTLSYLDEMSSGSRAKPRGIAGCEIWMKVGEPPPSGASELRYLATSTRSPYVTEFAAADAGNVAYYMLRWVNTRGERGPWSQTVSGTITG